MTTKKPSYEELQPQVVELEQEVRKESLRADLRQSRELFEKVFRSQRDAIFILNAETPPTILDCNAAAEGIFGYSRHEMLGKNTQFLHMSEKALAEFQKDLYPQVTEQGFFRLEGFMMKRKDGNGFPTDHTVMPLNNEKGERTGWVSVVRDITARKNAEEAEKKISEVFRSVVEDMPALMCRFLPDGTLTFVNRNYCDYFSRNSEHLIGQNFFQFIPEEERQEVKHRFSSLTRESPVITYEHQVIASDGARRWQQWTDRALFDNDGNLKEYQSLGLDVTDRKQAEEALRESEKRYKQLFSHAPAGICEMDFREQRFIAVNKIMCQFTGYSETEFLKMGPLDIMSEDAKALFLKRIKKLMVGENVPESVEYGIRTKGGAEIWAALRISPVFENGEVKKVTAVVHNITERRRVEQKLRQSEERLRALSKELMEAQEKERTRISKELHDELGQSLAILKHRVRSIGKNLGVYQPQMSRDSDAAVQLVDEIIEKVRHISRDLNPSILEDVGLCPALRSLADNFMQEYEIPVSLHLDEIGEFFSKETARKLYRIIQEALTNIAKHAEAHHVSLRISKGPEYVNFLIEDGGKGFDPTEARSREEKHRGLGLPLMEERADSVGGTLEITSQEGDRGTKILLTVPIEMRGT